MLLACDGVVGFIACIYSEVCKVTLKERATWNEIRIIRFDILKFRLFSPFFGKKISHRFFWLGWCRFLIVFFLNDIYTLLLLTFLQNVCGYST
jgi:hypothetical protein